MRKAKKAAVVGFLIILTIGMILVPMLINLLNFEFLLGEKTFWQYQTQTNHKMTSRQVAELYYHSSAYPHDISPDHNDADYHVSEFLDLVFGNHAAICTYIKNLTSQKTVSYSRNYKLASIENSPVVLSLVTVSYFGEKEDFSLIYEENTQTLISFVYHVTDLNNGDSLYHYHDDLTPLLTDYYENHLKLTAEQYYCESSDKELEGFIECGLVRAPKQEIEIDQ